MYEIWKPLVYHKKEFPNFEISNTGKLRNIKTGTTYRQYKNHNGYYQVCVSLGGKNNKKVFKIHKAVAETFIPLVENRTLVNHKDGNKENNNVDNLEWVTSQENVLHALKIGAIVPKQGTERAQARFTEEEIRYIRSCHVAKDKEFGCSALARKFNVNHSCISDIIHNKSYKNVV